MSNQIMIMLLSMRLFNCHIAPSYQGIDAMHVDESIHRVCVAVSFSYLSRKNKRPVRSSGDVYQYCDLMFYHGALLELPSIESRPMVDSMIPIFIFTEDSIPDFEKLLVFPHGLGVKTKNLGCGQLVVNKGGKQSICQRVNTDSGVHDRWRLIR